MNPHNTKKILFGALLIAGGAIAIVSAVFGSRLEAGTLHLLWDVEDTFYMLGLIGVFQLHKRNVGPAGLVGFSLAMLGLALLIGPNETPAGFDLYPYASSVFMLGLLILARICRLPVWVQFTWICSTILGLPAHLSADLYFLYLPTGVLFGVGFIGAGLSVALSQSR